MRPPEFTGGNAGFAPGRRGGYAGFNEAAGIHRRKPVGSVHDSNAVRAWLQ